MAPSRAKRLLLLWATFNTLSVQATPTPTKTASSSTTSTTGFTFSTDITNFIPSCALSCFKSFVEINFNTTACGFSPSLACLCQHTGSTGYTIGEGATECIVAENDLGNCRNASYGSDTVDKAYGMCNSIPSAAPETHATLIATLILNSGSIVVATPTPVPSTNKSSTTVAMTPTSTQVSLSLSSSTSTSTSTTVSPVAATSSTAAAVPLSNNNSNLSRAQIGGIAGGIAAIAILAALLALFLFLRRRKQRSSPAFSRMHDNSSWSPKRGIPQDSPSAASLSISQPRYQEPKVMSFTRALAKRVSMMPGRRPAPNYGLAISPGGGRKPGTGVGMDTVVQSPVGAPPFVIRNVPPSPEERRQQPSPPPPAVPPMSPRRALSSFNFLSQGGTPPQAQPQQQPRPTLALAIPQRASTQGGVGGRDSVITEFAEDGEDGPGSAQIWRPPNSADPHSAAAAMYYVADRWGNWVLREKTHQYPGGNNTPSPPAELATPMSKTKEEKAREEQEEDGVVVRESAAVRELRHYSSPTIPEALMVGGKRASAAGRPTIRLVTPDSGRLPMNSRARSSIYSSHPSLLPQSVVAPGADNPMPPAYTPASEAVLRGGGNGKGASRRRSSNKGGARRAPPPRPERQASRDSATTIMSQDSAATTIDDITSTSSPVEDMINAVLDDLVFPAALPRYSNAHGHALSPVVEAPEGRASPVRYPQIPRAQSNNTTYQTLAAAAGGPSKRPLPNPLLLRLAAQHHEQPLKDSPTLGLRKPSDRAQLPSQQHQHQRLSVYDAYNDPAAASSYPSPSPPPLQPAQYRAAAQQRPGLSQGQAYTQQRTLSPPRSYATMPSPPSTAAATAGSNASSVSASSSSSVLLSKRLGAERAAEFQRINDSGGGDDDDNYLAASAVPRGVVVRGAEGGGGTGRRYDVEWKPQLTPRRRGDELYLSVR